MAIAVFALAILTFIIVLVLPGKLYFIPVLLSLAGVLILQILRGNMLNVLTQTDTGMNLGVDMSKMLSLQAKSGYWLANIALILGGVVCLISGLLNMTRNKYNIPLPVNDDGFDHYRPIQPSVLHNSEDPIEEPFEAINEADEMLATEEETKDPEA
jgi:hypothetical protein